MPQNGNKIYLILLVILINCSLQAQYVLNKQYIQCSAQARDIIEKTHEKPYYASITQARQHINKIIYSLHQAQYISAVSDSIWISNDTIYALIFVGPCMKIQNTEIRCIDCDSNDFQLFNYNKKHNNPADVNELAAASTQILSFLENHGYPFAEVKIAQILPDENGGKAVMEIKKNNFILFDSIITEGNVKLHQSFLYGYLGIKRKKAYNASVVNKVNDKLQNLNYLQLTRNPGVSFSQDKAALYIFAEKKKVNQFEGYLGLVPSDEISGKVLVTGNINLNLNNIFGIGEHLLLSWKRTQVQSQLLDIAVDFPYLFYTALSVDASFNMEKKDTQYLNLYAEAGLRYYLLSNGYIKVYYAFQNSRLTHNESLKTLTVLPGIIDYNMHWYGFSFNVKHLDYIYNPHKGYQIDVNLAAGNKKIIKNAMIEPSLYNGIADKTVQLKAGIAADFYFPMGKRWTWVLMCKAAHLQAGSLYENELLQIGGLNTLRGFDHHSILASTYVILSNEVRFSFAKQSYLQAFFDAAGYEKKHTGNYVSDFPFGFGLGIAFNTKAGIFSLSYALGKQRNNPIKFATGKINFGYSALF